MPRDYKNIAPNNQAARALRIHPALAFLAGLAVGLLAALPVFLYYDENYAAPESAASKSPLAEEPAAEPEADSAEAAVPKPRFDFYQILPHREVNISEWVAAEPDKEELKLHDAHVYVLQVGSFKQYEAAEQTRAKLALLGLHSDIQRVVINGQDVRHRVRIGPHKDLTRLSDARLRLRENQLDFMVLRLRLDEDAAAE